MNKVTGLIVATAVCALFASGAHAADDATGKKADAKKAAKAGCKGKHHGKGKGDCKGKGGCSGKGECKGKAEGDKPATDSQ